MVIYARGFEVTLVLIWSQIQIRIQITSKQGAPLLKSASRY